MKYKEYLKSEHWINLKKETLTRRGWCQNCGTNKKLLLHHKNYKCLFNEKAEDIIILCIKCHHIKHKKKKFKIRGVNLDFTRVKNIEKPLYEISSGSTIKRECNRCGETHGLVYKLFKTGKLHLAMICHNSKPRTRFLPLEEGLNIPILGTKRVK